MPEAVVGLLARCIEAAFDEESARCWQFLGELQIGVVGNRPALIVVLQAPCTEALVKVPIKGSPVAVLIASRTEVAPIFCAQPISELRNHERAIVGVDDLPSIRNPFSRTEEVPFIGELDFAVASDRH